MTNMPNESQPWLAEWERIVDAINAQVDTFNQGSNVKCQVMNIGNGLVQVLKDAETVVLELDRDAPNIQVTCPLYGPGIGRRGQFAMKGTDVTLLNGEFVGEPKPPIGPLTPEKFAKAILEPFFIRGH
jgi:hypothetical protein